MCSLPAPTHVGNLKQAVAKTKAAATVIRHVEQGQHHVGPHQWALNTMHLAGQQASIFEGHCHGKLTTPILGMADHPHPRDDRYHIMYCSILP